MFLDLKKITDKEFIEYVLEQVPDERFGLFGTRKDYVRQKIGYSKESIMAFKKLYGDLEKWVTENWLEDNFPAHSLDFIEHKLGFIPYFCLPLADKSPDDF